MTRRRAACRLLLLLLVWTALPAATGSPAPSSPHNVILLIGDGMGLGQIDLARLSARSGKLAVDSMPFTGIVRVAPLRAVVPDSAAAGTALSTGYKTKNGTIAELPDGTSLRTILEASEIVGRATGLVTTTAITHATPACFAAHVPSRRLEPEIAEQLLDSGVDVLLGGGHGFFVPHSADGSLRQDNRDLLATAVKKGFTVVETRADMLRAPGPKLLGLFAPNGMTTKPPEPSLAEMTRRALDLLATDDDGFFLMTEGGQIDWASHDNDADGTVEQMRGFDDAIEVALAFARDRGDTLVLVTADHETGGLILVAEGEGFAVHWATGGHSGSDVALFAEGPGADRFTGVMASQDVPRRLATIWKLPGIPGL